MKRIVLPLLLAIALTTVAVPVQADSGPNEEQEGRTAFCSGPGSDVAQHPVVMQARSHLTGVVDVEAGTNYTLTVEEGPHYAAQLQYFNDDGENVGQSRVGTTEGTVPAGASWAIVCAKTLVGFWEFSTPTSEFTYQDGF